MGIIGKEIVLARTYEDEKTPPPNLNYKLQFPISVLEAIKESIEDADKPDAKNLKEIIEDIYYELQSRQPILPGHDPNNLMTFAGVRGAVGAIPISREIPWDPEKQSHQRIPTEKAVGDLLFKLGLLDEDGNPIDPERDKIRWSDIIGRPLTYEGLGDNDNGFITQKGITDAFNGLKTELLDMSDLLTNQVNNGLANLSSHINNKDNPHCITITQIGAASAELFNQHCNESNPHNTTKDDIGLDQVDNTSDMDKPISNLQKAALDALEDTLNALVENVNSLDFVKNATYDQPSGYLTMYLRHGDEIKLYIPIDDLVDDIKYDIETKELVVTELNEEVNRVDLSDLFIRYIGSVTDSITVSIIGTNETGEQIIEAKLNPKSITSESLGDGSIVTRVLADKSVTGAKIANNTILSINYADESVITNKIAKYAVTSSRLADRSVNGRILFSSDNNERILGVKIAGSDPSWTQLTSGMIGDKVILTQHYADKSVTEEKLADESVSTDKIIDASVIEDKLAEDSVTTDKIKDESVNGHKIVKDVTLFGKPKLWMHPDIDAKGLELIDADWVFRRLDLNVNQNHNYGDRSVDGRVLFTSNQRHRVLAVLRANTDPVWSLIDEAMMDDNSISTRTIQDAAINKDKIADESIHRNHLKKYIISENYIDESAVTPEKIFKSGTPYSILGILGDTEAHPQYVKVVKEMMDKDSVGNEEVIDRSLSTSKIQPSETAYRVLITKLKGSNPVWGQITTNMIADRTVNGRNLFSSSERDTVLTVIDKDTDPMWRKIYSELIEENAIKSHHIVEKAIGTKHLQDAIINSEHIHDYSIQFYHLADESVIPSKLLRSELNNRVLATVDGPYSIPRWAELNGKMLQDESIEKEKLFRSNYPYRVLATTQAGTPPEYIRITSDFIVDDSIIPQKLVRDFVLFGTPELTVQPNDDASNLQLANTAWVRKTVANMINDFDPTILFDQVYTDMIQDKSITGSKLFRSKYDGPRVLGVTEKDEIPEWMLIENGMIADGAVTEEKLGRDIHLLGTPTVDVRPSPLASDAAGGGNQIPDCQWVLDRISGAGIIGDGTVPSVIEILKGSITTDKIQNRAVTGDKLFTSKDPNMVLGVLKENTSPIYTKVINKMIEDRAVESRHIFSSAVDNRVLAVVNSGNNPEYTKINRYMMGDDSVGEKQILDLSITKDKLANESVTKEKLAKGAVVDTNSLFDNSVVEQKIKDKNVTRNKIADDAVDSTKLERDLILRGTTIVNNDKDCAYRSARNTIISVTDPLEFSNGDIWFQYS